VRFREVDRLLKDNDWIPDKKGKGTSHVYYRKEGKRKVPVPDHPGDIPKGTLEAILKGLLIY